MFLAEPELSKTLTSFPRVCGDVSNTSSAATSAVGLSPRMRGCFFKIPCGQCIGCAFPAYAGMFPRTSTAFRSDCSFPRVCGDVSRDAYRDEPNCRLSPRMRGCFSKTEKTLRIMIAFPAYAGMFLGTNIHKAKDVGFPRVCGDVSTLTVKDGTTKELSPRMRGCFR